MAKKYKVGLFPMVGDMLHIGHVKALQLAKEQCDKLIVALNCCPLIGNPDKRQPVETIYERYGRLKAIDCVDEVIPYEGEPDLELLLKTTRYDVRFIGEDHDNWTGSDYESEQGIDYFKIPRAHGMSSTKLAERAYNIVESMRRSYVD